MTMNRSGRVARSPAARLVSGRRAARARSFVLALLSASFVLVTGAADAQSRHGRGGFFERLDANGDGVVDREELQQSRRAVFRRVDADGDGYLSGAEIEVLAREPSAMPGGQRRGVFSNAPLPGKDLLRRLDSDGDGRIAESEFLAAEHPLLERLDTDRDGRITRDEAERAQSRAQRVVRRRSIL